MTERKVIPLAEYEDRRQPKDGNKGGANVVDLAAHKKPESAVDESADAWAFGWDDTVPEGLGLIGEIDPDEDGNPFIKHLADRTLPDA